MLQFKDIVVKQTKSEKHLGMLKDSKLCLRAHLRNIRSKVNKSAGGLLPKFVNVFSRPPLLRQYKSNI